MGNKLRGGQGTTGRPLGDFLLVSKPSCLPFSSRSSSLSWMRTTCVMSSGESVSPSTEPTCTSCTTSMSPLQTTRTSPWLLSSPWTGKQTGPHAPHSPLAAALHPVEWRRERWPHRLRTLKPAKIGLLSHPLSSTENQGLLSPDGAGCL